MKPFHVSDTFIAWDPQNGEKEVGYDANCKETDDFMIRCFDKPIDPSEVESIILHADWATFPASAERFLTEDGWE